MTAKFQLQDVDAKYLDIVSTFAIEMLSLHEIDEILWHLARNVVAQLGFDDVVIYLLDESRDVLVQKASFGAKNPKDLEILSPIELKVGEGVVGQVAKIKKPLLITDTRRFPNYIVDDAPRLSELAVPMIVEGEVVGVIDSEHPKKNFYTQQHEHIVMALASITAMKIHKAKTLVKLQNTIEELEYSSKIQDALFEIAELIFETDSLNAFYKRLHQCIGRLTFAKNFYVAILDEDRSGLNFVYHVDEFDQLDAFEQLDETNRRLEIDPSYLSITGYVLLKNKPLLVNEAQIKSMVEDKTIQVFGKMPNAWLGVPFGDDQFKGIVVVQSYADSYQFQQKDKQLLVFVAKHIRNAIERMNVKSRMEFLALHDSLTGLPNRTLFIDRLTQAINNADEQSGVSLLYMDVDRFKSVNDTYGHHLGDELLKGLAERLSQALGPHDTLCRLSGDEFAILLSKVKNSQHSEFIAAQLLSLLEEVIDLGGIRIKVSISIGIVNCFNRDLLPNQLLMLADEAMYKAKLQGRNQIFVCNEDMEEGLTSTYKLEREFLLGIEKKQFYLEYQPVYELKTDLLVGAEALIRWKHPQHGILGPGRFLPELQRSGLLEKLDLYVVQHALEFMIKHQLKLPSGFKLSVNVSGVGLNSGQLLNLFEYYYCHNSSVLSQICVEITEQTLVTSVEETTFTIERLRQMGISLSLDDFGTGYSSLSYLHKFVFDMLKIDRSFISHMDMAYDNRVILETIINLARSLNIKTVAEGVETQEQYQSMQVLGCDYAQGYFMHPPLAEDVLFEVVNNQHVFNHIS
ncbi:GGDEF domain-containing protein [Shewanella sp. Isolate11]|uniref:bifunctional diguanylate cyclase/phosphodiesterase n=1 Tax=Shewanella sp. Isolate11 TaxID=2908530 RepID=UPI001EFCBD29|nr:GGDEF domain-containing protein [Shewanella sp. Isolate11]MCG9696780.1 GGDEF domain-containing protein [Shewanella sp. Isolate11]